MTITEERRWQRARAYALRQRCDQSAACEYADWIVTGVRGGSIIAGTAHGRLFAAWLALVDAAGRS